MPRPFNPPKKATCLYDFRAVKSDELNLATNDPLTVLEEVDEHWYLVGHEILTNLKLKDDFKGSNKKRNIWYHSEIVR